MAITLNRQYTITNALADMEDGFEKIDNRIQGLLQSLFAYIESGVIHPENVSVALYQNGNYHAAAVVAKVSTDNDNQPREWAAYWGGAPAFLPREHAALWVAQYGNKLEARDAHRYFPDLGTLPYRH